MDTRKIVRYVSLVVDVDQETESGPSILKSKEAIKNLLFFDREEKFPFVFKCPDSLSQ